MNASVAGLNAQASQLAAISDNIANSATPGYKRAETEFAAMVLEGSASGYTAGGVRSLDIRLVEERGALTTSSNPTDLAITGRGMLPVASLQGVREGEQEMLLTTTGSFRTDSNGYLATPAGLVLLGVPVGPDGTTPDFSRTTPEALVPVRITANEVVGSPTTTMEVTANLPATSTEPGAAGTVETLAMTYYDNLGRPQTLTFTYTPVVPAAGEAATNAWTLAVTDSAQGGALVGEYALEFSDDRAAGGTLQTVTTLSGGAYDPATGALALDVAGGPLDVTIGRPGLPGGTTQLATGFTPVTMTKDGAPTGSLTGVEVDAAGFVVATYDSGETRRLFQVPIADVANPNGLQPRAGQTWAVSNASGPFYLWDAGEGPVGEVAGYAREGSTVDIAHELTQLIETQRAYSSNAKVIQTVDEMLQETTNIKR
jgi:flagellar hook protein FlgE